MTAPVDLVVASANAPAPVKVPAKMLSAIPSVESPMNSYAIAPFNLSVVDPGRKFPVHCHVTVAALITIAEQATAIDIITFFIVCFLFAYFCS